ncbi:MAG: HAD family hydrolase [Hymenobacteraceae bacterium]|nr:HAD family hydrolase [Hymenobacteraceae bacterium]
MEKQKLQKCVFLDRDGVLNRERGDYTYLLEDFEVLPGVPEALQQLKQQGYLLIVITNQGGIAKGLYSKQHVLDCHHKLQQQCSSLIDAIYYAPAHPAHSQSLSRKPDTLLLEKAIAKYHIDPSQSWFIGDQLRDMQSAEKMHIPGILISDDARAYPLTASSLLEATEVVLGSKPQSA